MNTKFLQRSALFTLFCFLFCVLSVNAQHFRVTLNGFEAVRLTNEGFTDGDGDGDEITFISDAVTLNPSGTLNSLPRAASRSVISVANAGCRPGPCVWRLAGPVAGADPLPLVLFDGNINPGSPAIIIPTIWEMDDNPSWELLRKYTDNLAASGPNLQAQLHNLITASPPLSIDSVRRPASGLGFNNSLMLLVGGWPQDRPIGVTETRYWNQYDFTPKALALNSRLADFISRSDLEGFGQGIIEVTYAENSFMAGSYKLYLQVERVEAPCLPDLTSTFTGDFELRTSNRLAPGPFRGRVSMTANFTNCRSSIQVVDMVPIQTSFIVPTPGMPTNTTTVTQTGVWNGTFEASGSNVNIPIALHFQHSLEMDPNIGFLFPPSDLRLPLTTQSVTGGTIVLSGSGPFTGGSLEGSTGTLRITGSFSPQP